MATTDPKVSLSDKQKAWLKEAGTALGVGQTAAAPVAHFSLCGRRACSVGGWSIRAWDDDSGTDRQLPLPEPATTQRPLRHRCSCCRSRFRRDAGLQRHFLGLKVPQKNIGVRYRLHIRRHQRQEFHRCTESATPKAKVAIAATLRQPNAHI